MHFSAIYWRKERTDRETQDPGRIQAGRRRHNFIDHVCEWRNTSFFSFLQLYYRAIVWTECHSPSLDSLLTAIMHSFKHMQPQWSLVGQDYLVCVDVFTSENFRRKHFCAHVFWCRDILAQTFSADILWYNKSLASWCFGTEVFVPRRVAP